MAITIALEKPIPKPGFRPRRLPVWRTELILRFPLLFSELLMSDFFETFRKDSSICDLSIVEPYCANGQTR